MEVAKKVVLLGKFGVGKTSITRRYLLDIFEHDYLPTLGVQIKKKIIETPSGNVLSMIIWDLEGFNSVSKTRASYLLGSSGFIYVFDVTRPFTYHDVREDLAFIKTNYAQVALKIVGNKIDLESPNPARNYLKDKNIVVDYFVSAKTGDGVHDIFADLANTFGI